MIAEAGWTNVRYRNLTGGIVALHAAERDPGYRPEGRG
jgi:ubiquinone/menaquinone biosynthesis C-methylase UbiE